MKKSLNFMLYFIPIFIIVLIFKPISYSQPNYPTFVHNRLKYFIDIAEGKEIHLPHLRSLSEYLSKVNPYWKYVLEVDFYRFGEKDATYCFLGVSRGYINVDVIGENSTSWFINYTFLLENATIICSNTNNIEKMFGQLKWSMISINDINYNVSNVRHLLLNRKLTISKENGETFDENGYRLGEWIVFLSPRELSSGQTLLLGLLYPSSAQIPERNFSGVVLLLHYNVSRTGQKDYYIGEKRISRTRTAVAIPISSGVVKVRFATNDIETYNSFVGSVKKTAGEYKGLRIKEFGNMTLEIKNMFLAPFIYGNLSLNKPWKLSLEEKHLSQEIITLKVVRASILYEGREYMILPFSSIQFIYDVDKNVLLEVSPIEASEGNLVLPCILSNYIRVDENTYAIWKPASGKFMGIRLVESTLHTGEVQLGGPGKPSLANFIANIALAVSISIILSILVYMVVKHGRKGR